jgi:DNA-binding MarR family transcriptional regulator
MERDGLITRRRDAADERRVLIDLTEKGRQLQTRALEVPRSLARQLSIEPQAVEDLRASVKSLVRSLTDAL